MTSATAETPSAASVDSRLNANADAESCASELLWNDLDRLFVAGLLCRHALNETALLAAIHEWIRRPNRRSLLLAEFLIANGWVRRVEWESFRLTLQQRSAGLPPESAMQLLHDLAERTVCLAIVNVRDAELRRYLGSRPVGPSPEDRLEETAVYRHLFIYAEGGLGRVWIARDESLQRDVALKEVRPELRDNPEVTRRFVGEARVTGRLQHPNIVPVYWLGRDRQTNETYYTMPFLSGRTLDELIAERHGVSTDSADSRLQLTRHMEIFLKVCDAVAYAHSRGVIHRDLKPANVLVEEFGEVFVLDWGIAKELATGDTAADATASDDKAAVQAPAEDSIRRSNSLKGTQETRLGTVLGSPAFMAPEQAIGDMPAIGPCTDVYGLGAILFKILTGSDPHFLKDGESVHDLLARIATSPTPRVRQRTPTASHTLDAICAKAMSRNPASRYVSVPELAAEVRRWIANEPVSVYREPMSKRIARWMIRHQSAMQWLALTGATAIIVLTALVTFLFTTANGMVKREINNLTVMNDVLVGDVGAHFAILREDALFLSDLLGVRIVLAPEGVTPGIDRKLWHRELSRLFSRLLHVRAKYLDVGLTDGKTLLAGAATDSNDLNVVPIDQPYPKGSLRDIMDRALALERNQVYFSAPWVRPPLNPQEHALTEVIRIIAAIRSDDGAKVIGAIYMDVEIEAIVRWRELTGSHAINKIVYVTDEKGTFLVHPDDSQTLSQATGTAPRIQDEYPALAPLFLPVGAKTDSMLVYDKRSNGDIVFAKKYHYVAGAADKYLVVALARPYEQVTAGSLEMVATSGRTIATVIVFVVVLGIIAVRMLSRAVQSS